MEQGSDFASRPRSVPIAWWFLSLAFFWVWICPAAWARPTTAAQARQAVETWLALDPRPLEAALGQEVAEVQAFPGDTGEPHYYVVYLNSGGFVVVAGDDLVEPIIAFISRGRYDPSLDTPLGALVSQDLAGRVAAAREMESRAAAEELPAPTGEFGQARRKWLLLAQSPAAAKSQVEAAGLPNISDVWVAPFVLSRWGQGYEYSGYCYNYYTPNNHSPCGCMATASAQLMRYHSHPTTGVGTPSFTIYLNGAATTASLRGGDGNGGAYDWANMVLDPDVSITDAQRQAIGALCYDAGVAINTDYRTSIALAYFREITRSLLDTFKYSNAIRSYNNTAAIPLATLYRMINPNLDTRLPTPISLKAGGTGHGVLADGYGKNLDTWYHHLNMGWNGNQDAWYNLPNVQTTSTNYSLIDRCGYNIYPSGTGEIISGRVTGAGGNPVAGAAVLATKSGGGSYAAATDSRGIYALARIPAASTYNLKATKSGYAFTPRTVATGTSQSDTLVTGNVWGADFPGTGGPTGSVSPIYQLLLSD